MPGYKVYGRQLTWLDYKLARRRRLLLEANVHPALKLYYDFTSNPSLTDHDSLVTTTPDLSITRATSATVIDSNGLIHEVSAGVARFDGATYSGDTASGTSNGLLVEEARTNICLYSEDMSNAAWVASNVTKGANASVSPDGSTTADRLTASAGNGTVLQSITSASADRSFAVYIKRVTGTGDIDLTVDGGSTWTTVAVDGTWTRFDIQQAAVTNPQVGFRIVTSADAIDVWGAQLEAGAFPTSYIPTTTASVTRNADLITTSDVTWYDSSAATFYIKWNQAVAVNGGRPDSYLLLPYTDASNEIRVWSRVNDNLQVIIDATTNQVSTIDVTDYAAGTHEFVFGLSTNDYAGYYDGSVTETDTSAVLPSIDTLYVGSGTLGGNVYTGLIKEIRYYDERLDDSLLEDLSNGDGDGYF